MAANLVLNLSQPAKSREGREHASAYLSHSPRQPPNTGAETRSKLTRRESTGGGMNKTQRRVASEKEKDIQSKAKPKPRELLLQDIDPSRCRV